MMVFICSIYKKEIDLGLAIWLLSLILLSCGNGGHVPEPREATESAVSAHEDAEEPKASKPRVSKHVVAPENSHEMVFDFAKNLARAHLRSGGLLIDFGTPSRQKHTFGDWKSGWRGDFAEEGVTYSYMAQNAATIFFNVTDAEVGNARITLRARPLGSQKGRVYLNGEYAGAFELTDDGFGHASVEAGGGLRPGSNQIMIRCNGRKKAKDGKKAALAVDYVRVTPSTAARGTAAASWDAVRFPDPTGGPDGFVLNTGESLTFNLPIPAGARIRGQARVRTLDTKGRLEIVANLDNSDEQILLEREINDRTSTFNIAMAGLEGQVAALTFRAAAGEVVLQGTGLFEPKKAAKKAPGEPRAKNFVLILIDTLRADRLSLHNKQTRVRTDYMDRLGKESMVFDRALAPENWTKPSVASLFSGLYPDTHHTQGDRDKLPKSVVTTAEHLSTLGFATAGFVANGYVSSKFGFKQGWSTWTNYVREHKANRAQYVVKDAALWLESRPADKPFFLYVHTIDPHVPYIPPRKYWSLYDSGRYQGPVQPTQTAKLLEKVKTGKIRLSERDKIRLEALYDGEITYHDDQLVKLHDALAKHGLLDDTLIVVTSDHGEELFDHGSVGHGHSLYEELLHVPLIFRLPGSKEGEGTHSSAEVNLVDVLPTACGILGIECPTGIEGKSMVPLLRGAPRIEFPSVSFSYFLNGQRAARMGRYKFITKGLNPSLYDLKTDPKETHNLAAKKPVTLAALRDALGMHLGRIVTAVRRGKKNPRVRHKGEKTVIDPETKRQLKALGYLGGE
ncbi:MAG: sulfatase-like hydrolase/transferase [Deltaproteobacteria bacterium]|nr:sulfatase-like hydrolase/transferase [Deltaproteobacteria bacterium]